MLRRRHLRSLWSLLAAAAMALTILGAALGVNAAGEDENPVAAQDCAVMRASRHASASTARIRHHGGAPVATAAAIDPWPDAPPAPRLTATRLDRTPSLATVPIPIRC